LTPLDYSFGDYYTENNTFSAFCEQLENKEANSYCILFNDTLHNSIGDTAHFAQQKFLGIHPTIDHIPEHDAHQFSEELKEVPSPKVEHQAARADSHC